MMSSKSVENTERPVLSSVWSCRRREAHSFTFYTAPKRWKIIKYSNRTIERINDLDSAGHAISEIQQKRALLRGLPSEYDITVEIILRAGPSN